MAIFEYQHRARLETPNPSFEAVKDRVGSFAVEFQQLSEWHDFIPPTISQDHIGSRLAGILLTATTLIDDHIDTRNFPSHSKPAGIIDHLFTTPIHDYQRRIQCSSLTSVLLGTWNYIESEPHAGKKAALIDAYVEMLRVAPDGLQQLMELRQTTYSADHALQTKMDSHWSIYKVAMLLQSKTPPTPLYLHLVQTQGKLDMLIDDWKDFAEDQKTGDVNSMQGYINQAIAKGYATEKALKYAQRNMRSRMDQLSMYIELVAPTITNVEKIRSNMQMLRNSGKRRNVS